MRMCLLCANLYLVCMCVFAWMCVSMWTYLSFCVSLCECVSAHYLWSRAGSIKQITPLLPIFQHITSSRAWWEPIMKGPALAKSRVSTAQTLSIHPSLHFPLLSPFLSIFTPPLSAICYCISPEVFWSFLSSCTSLSAISLLPALHPSTACLHFSCLLHLPPSSLPTPVSHLSFHQAEWPNLSLLLPPHPSSFFPLLPLGTNLDNLDQREHGRVTDRAHTTIHTH